MALKKITEVNVEENIASSDYVIGVVGGKVARVPVTSIEAIVDSKIGAALGGSY